MWTNAEINAADAFGAWQPISIPLRRFGSGGFDLKSVERPFRLATADALTLTLSDVRIGRSDTPSVTCGT
ncbi:putative glycoside hydrolase [Sphingomonas sp. LT1P40]